MKSPNRIIEIEIWLVIMTIVFVVFITFNGSMKTMNGSCESVNQDLGVNCDYDLVAPNEARRVNE